MAAGPPNCGDNEGKSKNMNYSHEKRINPRSGSAWRKPALVAGLTLPLAALPLLALAAPNSAAPKADAALSQALRAKTQTGWAAVILKTTAPLSPAQEAQMTALGADIIRRLPIIQSVAVRVPQRNLARLAALPFAAHLSLDGRVKKTDEFTVASSRADRAFVTTYDTKGKNPQTYKLTGAGVTVAVIDSGVTPVADLSSQSYDLTNSGASRLIASVNFSAPLSASTGIVSGTAKLSKKESLSGLPLGLFSNNAYDPCGHGTHVAGIIGGNGSRSGWMYCTHTFNGIAPQANLVSVRVLDRNGCSDVSTVLAGLQWVLNNKDTYKIKVVNLSLGHPVGESYTTDPICQAVEALYKSGVVVVCAAGNEGRLNGGTYTAGLDNEGWGTDYGSIQSPGNDPYIITVGATKSTDGLRGDDKIATYSSRGPSRLDLIVKPDIIAAGNKVISLDAHGSTLDSYAGGTNDIPYSSYVKPGSAMLFQITSSSNSTDYFQLSGTSMASPVVAGAAALLLQANPKLTPDTIKARLMLSADKWAAPDGIADPLTYGAGYLNIPAALASTVVASGPAASPALVLGSDGSIAVSLDRALWGTSLWGTGITDLRAMWGTRALWGTSSIDASRAMWGTNLTFRADRAIWGTSTPSASRAMWGSSVWADRAMWGTSSTAVDLNSAAITGEQ